MVFENAISAMRKVLFVGFVGLFLVTTPVIADESTTEDPSSISIVLESLAHGVDVVVDYILPDFIFDPPEIALYVWEYKSLDREVKCLADNIYFEAGHEEQRGQIAVGLVTINRVKSNGYPDSICGVVWQANKRKRDGKTVAQFSWTKDGRSDVPRNRQVWEECYELAKDMLKDGSLDNYDDFTKGATHYHATYVKPRWRTQMEKVEKIGLHIFYRDPTALGTDA